MKRIYRVEYEEKWTGCKDWIDGHIDVMANGDMDKAVAKARRHSIGQTYKDEEKGKLQRCIAFRATGIKVLAEADI